MLFEDGRFDEYERRVKEVLYAWEDYSVLDVACGYGRLAPIFDQYLGIDFSEEMIKLARERNEGKKFECLDVRKFKSKDMWDVVFEVNSLKSLDMSFEQFCETFGRYARKFVACLEADGFHIRQVYRKL